MSQFPLMARFNEWANARLYGAVARLSEEDYRTDRGLFFGSVHRTLNHLLVVDRIWTRRIEGVPHGIASLDALLHDSFSALKDARIDEDRRLIRQVEEETRRDADRRARSILAAVMQRVASSHATETTVSVVELKSDELKGRTYYEPEDDA